MVQNVRSFLVPPGTQELILEKPRVLHRIFFGITMLAGDDVWRQTRISFDGPHFDLPDPFYIIDGPYKHFEVKGDGISQGDIWIRNVTDITLHYTTIEILV